MAQHDYVIDNQAFPATRADINSVLQAIVTNNSGSSAPSTTFANQIWYDSSANILYMRNEDNDANIPLFNLDQSNDVASLLATIIDIVDASGTNTAGTDLTIRAGAGTGTGAGGNIILQTANAGSSGSSVNSHATAVTVDDGGQVGIGTTPTAQLHISGDDVSNQVIIENTSADANNAPDLLLRRNSASPADNDEVGNIVFQGRNDNSQFPSLATMRVIFKDVTDTTEDAALVYKVMTDGTLSEVMRLESGHLAVGETTPVSLLHVHENSTNDAEIHMTNNSSGATASDGLTIFANSGSAGLLYRENSPFRIFTNGAEVARFGSGGNMGIGTTSPSGKLHVAGTIVLSASGTDANRADVFYNTSTGQLVLVTSDARLKKDFDYDIDGIETVKKLKPLYYSWKDSDKRQLGFLAQESIEADEHLAWNDTENDDWGLEGWDGFAAVLTKAIQEQQVIIEDLKARIETLESA